MYQNQLPESIVELAQKLRLLPGVGRRSSERLALDIVQLVDEDFTQFYTAINTAKQQITFCSQCGFFAERVAGQQETLCPICKDSHRNTKQICICERPTDVITMEKSNMYRGCYQVLDALISPLDNVFAEDTALPHFLDIRLPAILEKHQEVELILFFKAGFGSEATTAFLKESIRQKDWADRVSITRLAQGLPLSFNPDTLDAQTIIKALEDRREI
jgi:recombination protein RecR